MGTDSPKDVSFNAKQLVEFMEARALIPRSRGHLRSLDDLGAQPLRVDEVSILIKFAIDLGMPGEEILAAFENT